MTSLVFEIMVFLMSMTLALDCDFINGSDTHLKPVWEGSTVTYVVMLTYYCDHVLLTLLCRLTRLLYFV